MSLQPVPVDGWSKKLVHGCALWLNDAGVVEFVLGSRLTGARPGLHTDGLPPAPDRAVSLSLYAVDEDPGLSDVVVGLQTISRGAPGDRWQAIDLDDALFVALEGAHDLVWGGIPIVLVQRRSGTSLGQDGNRRWEQVSNYWVTTTRPTPNRVD
ncbi:MAG: hypothetical protein IE926_01905 [Micrococcales bacterium]|nr:hypothetical protein [Micrococcales bacterium]